jgi:hypothetical protein
MLSKSPETMMQRMVHEPEKGVRRLMRLPLHDIELHVSHISRTTLHRQCGAVKIQPRSGVHCFSKRQPIEARR